MRKHEIWKYITHTPGNTNFAILSQLLDEFANTVKNPLFNYEISVDRSSDLLGKKADDLQSNVVFKDGVFYGTLHYVTGYTGFSGNEEEQSGHYLTFKIVNEDADIIKVNGSTLDSDGIIVLIMKEGEKVKVELTKNEDTVEEWLDVSNLVFE